MRRKKRSSTHPEIIETEQKPSHLNSEEIPSPSVGIPHIEDHIPIVKPWYVRALGKVTDGN